MCGLVGCATRSRVALVVKAAPATVQTKLLELTGERAQLGSSIVLGQPVGNPRFIIRDASQRYNTLPWHTEVEVVPYRKTQTLLRARTGGGLKSSFVNGDHAIESAVLRMCADYIERGVKPAGQQVISFEHWLEQNRTNQFSPPAQTPDWVKPELRLK